MKYNYYKSVKSFASFIAFLVLLSPTSLGENPGLRAVITTKGLNYACHSAINTLQKALPSITIPDIHGTAVLPLNIHAEYSFSKIKLHNLNIPSCKITPSGSSRAVTLQSSGISVLITGHVSARVLIFAISSDAKVDLDDISLSVTVKISRDPSNGHATLSTTACSADVGKVQVSLTDHSALLKHFKHELESDIKNDFHTFFCSAATKLNENVNKELEALPLVTKINNITIFNYILTQDLVYTSEYVAAFLKGEFQPIGHPESEAPFSPAPLPPIHVDGQMLYVWMTDYTLNTAGYVLQQAGRLSFTVTPEMVPNAILNTSTFKLLVPKLYHYFPDMAMQLLLEATEPPHYRSTLKGGELVAFGNVTVEVILPNGSITTAFILYVKTDMDMFAQIHADSPAIITANVTHLNASLELSSSNIGPLNVVPLQDALNFFLTLVALPDINHQGFKIPTIDGISLVNPYLSFREGHVLLSTDVSYKEFLDK